MGKDKDVGYLTIYDSNGKVVGVEPLEVPAQKPVDSDPREG